jgi:hypothetical protein
MAAMSSRTTDPSVRVLLGAVRRRLWLEQFVRSTRTALWGTAAVMALAAALRLLTGQTVVGPMFAVVAVLWIAALVASLLRRPSLERCALFADRELQGESGYSTWLEASRGTTVPSDSLALSWLEQWTRHAVAPSHQLLMERRTPWRLAQPIAVACVCAILLAFASMLPAVDTAAPAEPRQASRDAPVDETAESLLPGETELGERLASALRTADRPDEADRGSMDAAGVAAPDGAGLERPPTDTAGDRAGIAGVAVPPGEAAAGAERHDAAESSAGTSTSAPGSGREAGAVRDDRTAPGDSRAAAGPLAVRHRNLNAATGEAGRRADMNQLATYDDEPTARGSGTAGPTLTPVAASPPPARREATLSPVEAAYVEAWLAARQERP